jgi:hypothetical protein
VARSTKHYQEGDDQKNQEESLTNKNKKPNIKEL